eukprot:TRINITY_DN305_c2_g1_i1.p1 TRINITY_DN305_c2_g1~~TRINITY_DN305_c2_g1_i1.p1  ORF type:complete len:1197 (+),score=260.68 TRINITY_DN305_c2_g1_i1:147-3737(+)
MASEEVKLAATEADFQSAPPPKDLPSSQPPSTDMDPTRNGAEKDEKASEEDAAAIYQIWITQYESIERYVLVNSGANLSDAEKHQYLSDLGSIKSQLCLLVDRRPYAGYTRFWKLLIRVSMLEIKVKTPTEFVPDADATVRLFMMALERLCPVNSICSMFLSYLQERLVGNPDSADPQTIWSNVNDQQVTFLGQQLELMISRVGSIKSGANVWQSYLQLLSRTSGMEGEIEEVKEAISLLEKRDQNLIADFSLRRKQLWKRVISNEDSALKDLIDAYDAEIARTEAEVSALMDEPDSAQSDALAVLLDLGVDHSIYLLANLLSKLVTLQTGQKSDEALQSTLLKITMRLSGYLTSIVPAPTGMLHQARRLRLLLKSNPFGFSDDVLAQFVNILRDGIKFAKASGDGALDDSAEFVIPSNNSIHDPEANAEALADAAQLYEGLDGEIDLTDDSVQPQEDAMDVSHANAPEPEDIDLNGSITEQQQHQDAPASTESVKADSSLEEGQIMDSDLGPPPAKRAKTEDTSPDASEAPVKTESTAPASDATTAPVASAAAPPPQPPKQSVGRGNALAYRGRGGVYPLRGRGRGGFRGGMAPQPFPHQGFYPPAGVGSGGYYPPPGNMYQPPGYFQPGMPVMAPGPVQMQPQFQQPAPQFAPGGMMQPHPAFLPQYLQTSHAGRGQQLRRPRGGPRRIAPVGIMGAVASGPTRFQRGSFRGFSATQTGGAEKVDEKQEGESNPDVAPTPTQVGKQHDDNFQLDSKFVSALLVPAPQLQQQQQQQQQGTLQQQSPAAHAPSASKPAAGATAAAPTPSPAAQNLEEAQKRLLDRKRLERDGSQGSQAQLSAAEDAKLENLLRDDRLYDLIEALKEKQHKRDRELNEERNRLIDSQRRRLDEMTRLNAMRLENTPEIPSQLGWVRRKNQRDLQDLEERLAVEMRKMTAHIVAETDELTRQQQRALESFGVPGFFVTNDPAQIALQSRILNKIADRLPAYRQRQDEARRAALSRAPSYQQPQPNPFDAILGSLPPDIAETLKVVSQNPQMLTLLTQMLAGAQTMEQRVEIIRQVGGLLRQNQMLQSAPVIPVAPVVPIPQPNFVPQPQLVAPPIVVNNPMLQPLIFQQPNFLQQVAAPAVPMQLFQQQPQYAAAPPPSVAPPGPTGGGGIYHHHAQPSYRGRGGSYDRGGGGRGRGGDRGGYYGRGR